MSALSGALVASWDKMLVQPVETNEPGRMLQQDPGAKKPTTHGLFAQCPDPPTSDDNFIQKATPKLAKHRGFSKIPCGREQLILAEEFDPLSGWTVMTFTSELPHRNPSSKCALANVSKPIQSARMSFPAKTVAASKTTCFLGIMGKLGNPVVGPGQQLCRDMTRVRADSAPYIHLTSSSLLPSAPYNPHVCIHILLSMRTRPQFPV